MLSESRVTKKYYLTTHHSINIFKDRTAYHSTVMTKELEKFGVNKEEFDEIVSSTFLSEREAQIHLIKKNNPDMDFQEIADELEIDKRTVYSYRRSSKDKIRKSKETIELNIS